MRARPPYAIGGGPEHGVRGHSVLPCSCSPCRDLVAPRGGPSWRPIGPGPSPPHCWGSTRPRRWPCPYGAGATGSAPPAAAQSPGGLQPVGARRRRRRAGRRPLRAVPAHPGRRRAHPRRHHGPHPGLGSRLLHAPGRVLAHPLVHARHGDVDRPRPARRGLRAVADPVADAARRGPLTRPAGEAPNLIAPLR